MTDDDTPNSRREATKPATERPAPATPDAPLDESAATPDPAADLPLETLAGELVMTKLVGPAASPEELQAIARLQVGGIILFGPSVVDEPQLRSLLASLRTARASAATRAGLPPGLLVSVDQEGGAIRNVPFAPPEHTQPGLAAIGDVTIARSEALATGRALHELGITMDLGPVSDLVQGPNRTMSGRSFGSDPELVATFIDATVRGLEQGGVAATAKHFPGFGASTANSDEDVAHVDRSLAELRREELVPFRAAIKAGTSAIMVSHGIHRELGSTRPGTLDPRIATTLLRDELGFTGVAMTDSMNARGLREAWGDTVPRACPVAIAAGIDLMLLTGTIETARLCRERILEAVKDGQLPEERVREAARRVIELRERTS
ncbi:MAG: putative beta-N-acetylglucosaminidase [Thermoleophilia bacterium]|nr:putative beta-N-acetylglucosaminidase [Thermoleophilia bacterium]